MQTGENEQALRKITDMTRLMSLFILFIHFYYYCYAQFQTLNYTTLFTDRLLTNIHKTGLFNTFNRSKLIALGLLVISLLGARGRKKENLRLKSGLVFIIVGLIIFEGSLVLFWVNVESFLQAVLYVGITMAGYLYILSGGTMVSRIIKSKFNNNDIFNLESETFPQEERLLENEYSINLPSEYKLKNKIRKSWINIINPFRGLLVIGTPGAGKSYFVIRHVITQHIQKGFSMFVYDFKYDDLSRIVYNTFEKYKHNYKVMPSCYFINFDTILHRCNPLEPESMMDITDAAESARTILLGLNREWIKRQGDFFVESAINFLTAVIWFLKKFHDGEFCTLPHVIELMQVDYDKLFPLLSEEPEIEVLINPFVNAYKNEVMEQLEGQIASAKVAMARLASPQLYYVLSGNDFTLDINNPEHPKIVCMGNNPQKIQIYGAVLSLYVNRLIKLVNKKGKMKCSLIFDEFPTIYLNNIDGLLATARSNQVATCLGLQDLSQLRKDYGKEQADVIMNIVGNVISGQVTGDTAKQLSDRIGKIMQERESLSINSADTSISKSKQLELAVPPSRISALSSGEFVGMVADDPECKIALKYFNCAIINNHEAIKNDEKSYDKIKMSRIVHGDYVQKNYLQIKQDVVDILYSCK